MIKAVKYPNYDNYFSLIYENKGKETEILEYVGVYNEDVNLNNEKQVINYLLSNFHIKNPHVFGKFTVNDWKIIDKSLKILATYDSCQVIVSNDEGLTSMEFSIRGKNLPKKVYIYGKSGYASHIIAINRYGKYLRNIKNGKVKVFIPPRYEGYKDDEDVLMLGLPFGFRSQVLSGDEDTIKEFTERLLGVR